MERAAAVSALDILEGERPPPEEGVMKGPELRRVYFAWRGQKKEVARRERFWEATNDNLSEAYRKLEERTEELRQTREALLRLNESLEQRVAAQVEEILERAREVEALNVQLQQKVRERSRELALALRRLAGEAGAKKALGVNDLVGDRTRLLRLLGEGGMGRVFLGEDLLTGRKVAVKLMHPNAVGAASELARFFGEAGAAAAIAHPGVVKTLHVDVTEEGQVYQLMDYVDGKDLGTRCREEALPIAGCARIGAAIAEAVAAAHSAGVVHRDLKPGNIMLCSTGPGVRVLDFGISKVLDDAEVGALTQTGRMMGTPAYMSPEQVRDSKTVGGASDVYSLGVVLFELLAGRLPFGEASLEGCCAAHLYETAPDVRRWLPEVPAELAELLRRCLAKQAAARPTAAELAAALAKLADQLGAGPASEYARVGQWRGGVSRGQPTATALPHLLSRECGPASRPSWELRTAPGDPAVP